MLNFIGISFITIPFTFVAVGTLAGHKSPVSPVVEMPLANETYSLLTPRENVHVSFSQEIGLSDDVRPMEEIRQISNILTSNPSSDSDSPPISMKYDIPIKSYQETSSTSKFPILHLTKDKVQELQITAICVDDVPSILKLLKRMLLNMGIMNVECYPNGSAGLEALKNKQVDIVLSDVQMPIMSGPEVTIHCILHCANLFHIYKVYCIFFVLFFMIYFIILSLTDGDSLSSI